MIRITVAGKSIDLDFPSFNNINVTQSEVWINGKKVSSINGSNVEVHIHGNVEGNVKAHGSVKVQGSVQGSVDAGGSVQCGDVGESVDAGGSVQSKKVGGNIDAGGSVHVS